MTETASEPRADVWMVRTTLRDLPGWPVPSGYRLRTYRPGDEYTWVALHEDAERFVHVTLETFTRDFGEHRDALPDRMFIAETLGGDAVGSATAWWNEDWRGTGLWGQVHWVIVAGAHQGKGIGRALVTQVLARLALTYDRALLGTYTGRPDAIKIYLDAGFQPAVHELALPEVRLAWETLQRSLQHPRLAQALAATEPGSQGSR